MAHQVERFVGAGCAAGTNVANLVSDLTGIGTDLSDSARKKLQKWREQNKQAEPIDEKIDELYMKIYQAQAMQQIQRELERLNYKSVSELNSALTNFFGTGITNDDKPN